MVCTLVKVHLARHVRSVPFTVRPRSKYCSFAAPLGRPENTAQCLAGGTLCGAQLPTWARGEHPSPTPAGTAPHDLPGPSNTPHSRCAQRQALVSVLHVSTENICINSGRCVLILGHPNTTACESTATQLKRCRVCTGRRVLCAAHLHIYS